MLTPDPDERFSLSSEFSNFDKKTRLYSSSTPVHRSPHKDFPLMKKAKKVLARLLKNHRNLLKDTRKVREIL
jgi:hypothetical protein